MATLTETAYYTRQVIKYGSIGLVGILVLWFVGTGIVSWWKATHPAPLPPPRVEFGRVADITFPESSVSVSAYDLQTPTGKLGKFPDRMLVLSAPSKRSGFLDADRAIDLASRLGFLFTPTQPSETLYRWTQSDPLPATLDVDIVSGHFTLKRQWQADPSLVVSKRFVSEQQTIMDAQGFLRGVSLLPADLNGPKKVSFWRAQGDRLVETISLSEADFVEVDMFRSNYQIVGEDKEVLAEYGFFTPDPEEGIVSVLLSGASDIKQKQIVEVRYNHTEVNYALTGEYPIKTVETAWEELKNGGGYIAALQGDKAVVRRIELGYYDSGGEQEYMMPIYVFTGDNDLVAYVSAIRGDVIKTE